MHRTIYTHLAGDIRHPLALLASEAHSGRNGEYSVGGMTMHESLIQALRFCASGEKFPRLCTEACPLYCAKGNTKKCVACIDNALRQAADALEKSEELRHGYWIETNEGTFCSECEKKPD